MSMNHIPILLKWAFKKDILLLQTVVHQGLQMAVDQVLWTAVDQHSGDCEQK